MRLLPRLFPQRWALPLATRKRRSAALTRQLPTIRLDTSSGFKPSFQGRQRHLVNAPGRLIEAGVIRPVVDKVFPFESTNEALAHVASGRTKGKVVIKVR